MDKYRAAAIVFYKIEDDKKLAFLGLEGKEWRHFGGKIEEQDEKDHCKTMLRELNEESEGQLTVDKPHTLDKIYDEKSKMVVYFKLCNKEFQDRLDILKPTKVKSEYKWMEANDDGIPKYIKRHLAALETKPKITIVLDDQVTEPLEIFMIGLMEFYAGYYGLINSKDQYFLNKLTTIRFKEKEKTIPIIDQYLKFGGICGNFLDLFTINGFVAHGWYDKIKFNMAIDQLFKS